MAKQSKKGFSDVAADFYQYHPQEKLAEVKCKKNLTIGMPREQDQQERRVPLRPEAVSILTNVGFEVIVESGAGLLAKHDDKAYSDSGAKIAYSPNDVFKSAIVLKIAPPTVDEVGLMTQGATVFSTMRPHLMKADYVEALIKKKIAAVGFGVLEDKVGGLPIVRAMSEIAGSTVMLIAAEYLSSVNDGKGIILGGITGVPPTTVVILGAGTVSEYAARTAIGLGAEVKIFDNHIYKLRRVKERLGSSNVFTSTIDNMALADALKTADVAIGALRGEKGRTPCVVTEEMVGQMKANSIVLDVAIDHGGCFETSEPTTHHSPIFRKYDVIHYCVPNIASRVARTATAVISNILTPVLLDIIELGGVDEMIYEKKWFAKGIYVYQGGVTNANIAEKFKKPLKNIQWYMAAKFS